MDKPDVLKSCTLCMVLKPSREFISRNGRCSNCRKLYYKSNKQRLNSMGKKRNDEIRSRVFDIIGRECKSCGEKEVELLSIDHVNNDRKFERSASSLTWKRDIINKKVDTIRYQTLCRNCNESKQKQNPTQLFKNRISVGINKICSVCKHTKDISHFSTSSHRGKKCLDSQCCVCARNILKEISTKCYILLGNSCECCGNDDQSTFNIDHIENCGSRGRIGTGSTLCRKILNGDVEKTLFQLLCANCNYSKMLHGSCIHKRTRNVTE